MPSCKIVQVHHCFSRNVFEARELQPPITEKKNCQLRVDKFVFKTRKSLNSALQKNEEGVDEVNGRTGERDAHFPGFHLRQNLNEKEKKKKRKCGRWRV